MSDWFHKVKINVREPLLRYGDEYLPTATTHVSRINIAKTTRWLHSSKTTDAILG